MTILCFCLFLHPIYSSFPRTFLDSFRTFLSIIQLLSFSSFLSFAAYSFLNSVIILILNLLHSSSFVLSFIPSLLSHQFQLLRLFVFFLTSLLSPWRHGPVLIFHHFFSFLSSFFDNFLAFSSIIQPPSSHPSSLPALYLRTCNSSILSVNTIFSSHTKRTVKVNK